LFYKKNVFTFVACFYRKILFYNIKNLIFMRYYTFTYLLQWLGGLLDALQGVCLPKTNPTLLPALVLSTNNKYLFAHAIAAPYACIVQHFFYCHLHPLILCSAEPHFER
jgi:hypothetical protein